MTKFSVILTFLLMLLTESQGRKESWWPGVDEIPDADKDLPCSSDPCMNGGYCNNYRDWRYTCACLPGSAGDHCQYLIDPCSNSPCQNLGLCRVLRTGSYDSPGVFKCICINGYKGRTCSIPPRYEDYFLHDD